MFKLCFRPRALKALKKIQRDHQLKINSALDNLKLGRFNLLDKVIASELVGGEFYLLYFQKKNELKSLIYS